MLLPMGQPSSIETMSCGTLRGEKRYVQVRWAAAPGCEQTLAKVYVSYNDITERKRAEEELQAAKQAAEASQAQYQQVVSMISDVVWRYQVDGRGQFVASYISPVADRLLGLPTGTIGDSFEKYFSYVDPDDLPFLQETLSRARDATKEAFAEYRLQRPDGTTLWVRSKGSAHLQPNERTVAFGTTTDITERKRAEAALRQSEERLRLAIEATRGGTYTYDSASEEGYWSPELKNLIGLGPDDPFPLDADNIPVAVHPQDRLAFLAAMAASIDPHGDGSLRLEFRVFHADRSIRWLQIIGRTSYGRRQRPSPVRAAGIVIDITERKKLQDEVMLRERQLKSLFQGATAGLALFDRDLRYVQINNTLAEMNGLSVADHLGRTVREVAPGWRRWSSQFSKRCLPAESRS